MRKPVLKSAQLIACHDCDLLHRYRPLPEGDEAKCHRCGSVLYRNKPKSLEKTFALSLAALILFVVANSFPFLAIRLEGQVTHSALITGVIELYKQDMLVLSVLVFVTSILAPGLQVLGLLYVLLPLRMKRSVPLPARTFRLVRSLEPWSMMEVFMLGILVSVVKLSVMAEIVPGIAVWSFGALIMVLAWAAATLDPKKVWDELEYRA